MIFTVLVPLPESTTAVKVGIAVTAEAPLLEEEISQAFIGQPAV